MKKRIESIIGESVAVQQALAREGSESIAGAADSIIAALRAGGKVLTFGNGGSAADSSHMAAELVGRFKKERKAFAAIALTTDTSAITAIANDYGYDTVFARQVEALGKAGDVAVAFSTSGNSKNVIEALRKARSLGMKTIGIVGGGGGAMKALCDACIVVGSKDTPRVQEAHAVVVHILCELIEEALCVSRHDG